MAEERFDILLRTLEAPVRPDDAFTNRLYAQLAAEAGFARGSTGRYGPLAQWLRSVSVLRPVRLAWIVLVLGLLTALAIGLLLIGSARERPEDIVERSQAVFRSPPPFAMTTRFADGSEARYHFDGRTLRLEVTKGRFFGELPQGWFFIRDAQRQARYDPEANVWSVGENQTGWALFQLEPTWVAPVPVGRGQEPPLVTCSDWQLGEERQVAGRTADEVRCGSNSYWVDRASGLLVRRVDTDTGSPSARWKPEVIALELHPTLSPEVFAFVPPPGARDEAAPPPLRPESDVLEVGRPAPPWSGTLLDGASFAISDLRGRPGAVFIWCSCAAGPQVRAFVAEARSRADTMSLVLVSMDQLGTTRGLVDWLGIETPVVHDARGELLETWGLQSFPALVLIRSDGTVADIHPSTFDREHLDSVLDALASGQPLPEPKPRPAPVVDAQGRQPLSSVLQVGHRAPELRGPRLGGGELSTAELVGKPTVVVHLQPPAGVGPPPTDAPSADRLLSETTRRAGRINVLLVAHGEPTPGATAAYLDTQGSTVPVVFDWDGTLHQRWGLLYWPTLVLLDAEGRVAGYYGPEALRDPGPLLDRLEAREPLPTP